MSNRMIGAVIFDMDGILTDTEPLHAECFIEAFRRFGVEVSLEEYRQAVTLRGIPSHDLFVSQGGDGSQWERVKSIKDDLMIKAIEERGRLIPGAVEFLKSLREAGVTTALATSARKSSLAIIFDHFDLWHHFDVFTTKDEVEVEKPDPAVFLLAAKKLGIDPGRCVVLEDSPRGIIAANRAGMPVIAIPNASTDDGDFTLATLVVDSFKDVTLDVIKGLID